jgi:hypothetical protein
MRKSFAKRTMWLPLQIGLFVAVAAATQFHGAARGQDASADIGPMPLTTSTLGMTGWRRAPISITTPALGMTGWRPDPVITITAPALDMTGYRPDPVITVTTPTLGMTGWRRGPITVTAPALGMTGWQRDPVTITITTRALGMTGWRRDPITITTAAFGMMGWASVPEQCSAPFVPDSAGERCACPAGLLPYGDACITAGAGPPADLRVENEGPGACEPGKICPFDILVTNVGAGPFHGPLVVRDEVNLADNRVSTAGSAGSCAAGTCVRPGVTLAPGGSERLTINVLVPASTRRGFRLQLCAELKVPETGDAPVRFVQLMLTAAGIDAGAADNQMGGRTRGGIGLFRKTVGLPSGYDIDEPLIAALKALMPIDPHPENDRDCTESRVVR